MTEAELLALVEKSWNRARGDRAASNAIETWLQGLSPVLRESRRLKINDDGTTDYLHPYLVPQLWLPRGYDVSSLSDVLTKTVLPLCRDGRVGAELDVMEHTLSQGGSYHVDYHYHTGLASLIITSWGVPHEITSGSLQEVLEYVAANHYYESL